MLDKSIKLIIASFILIPLSFGQIISNDGGSSEGEIIDRIIAQVGDNIILLSDIEAQKMQAKNENIPVDAKTECYMLEELLYQNLLLEQAKLDSIIISDGQVNAEMENRLRTIESQIGSREKLEAFYGKTYTQIKEEFREVIRDRMMSQEMERQITQDVTVTPRDVERFFAGIPEDSIPYVNEKIAIQQIVIYPKINQASKNKVIEKLRGWRVDILNGDRNFAAVATIHSEDQGSAKDGGKIEATRGMMVKPFEAAAFSLEVGEISDVVETQYGYHIIQLLDRKGDDYTIRHILKTPEVGRQELMDAAALMDECHARLKKNEITWEKAVQEYSEDEDTRQNNGNVSNPYTGDQYWDVQNINQIDPQIFGIINTLKDGQISEPSLYTDQKNRKQGVRLVRIQDRTKPHVANLKDDYNFIKQAAENEKKEQVIAKWVNEKVSKVYIKIDDNHKDCSFRYNWN